jgi:hypothetical protein
MIEATAGGGKVDTGQGYTLHIMLLEVERDTPNTFVLVEVEMDTPWTMDIHTAGGRKNAPCTSTVLLMLIVVKGARPNCR